MGPVCEIPLTSDSSEVLDAIDAVLAETATKILRTRRGRTWDIWVNERPFHVCVDKSLPAVLVSAGCNDPEDRTLLCQLEAGIVARIRQSIR
jgi:hypothetical protein